MRIEICSVKLSDIVDSFASQLQGTNSSDCNIHSVQFPLRYGQLKLSGTAPNNAISIIILEGTFKDDFICEYKFQKNNPLLFSYCREGLCFHSFSEGNICYQIAPLTSSISWDPSATQEFRIAAKIPFVLINLFVNKEAYNESLFGESGLKSKQEIFDDLFEKSGTAGPFFYQSYYSITILECIKKMQESQHVGLIKRTFWETRVMELLYLQLMQYKLDVTATFRKVMLREYDLQKITEAKSILIENYKSPPTIAELSKRVGINQQKLKRGFKLIYMTTPNKLLTDYRIETAALLLVGGDSVKYVVDEIGYSNRSHFARKFREKYGVLPKDYRARIISRIPKEEINDRFPSQRPDLTSNIKRQFN